VKKFEKQQEGTDLPSMKIILGNLSNRLSMSAVVNPTNSIESHMCKYCPGFGDCSSHNKDHQSVILA